MTNEEKVIDATKRVIRALQLVALNPEDAKIFFADNMPKVESSWVDYFVTLFVDEDLEGDEPQPLVYAPVNKSEIEHPKSEIYS